MSAVISHIASCIQLSATKIKNHKAHGITWANTGRGTANKRGDSVEGRGREGRREGGKEGGREKVERVRGRSIEGVIREGEGRCASMGTNNGRSLITIPNFICDSLPRRTACLLSRPSNAKENFRHLRSQSPHQTRAFHALHHNLQTVSLRTSIV